MAAGVYLHIPFCKSRCSYCDFATDVWRSDDAVERYVAALCNEISGGNPNSSEGVRNAARRVRTAEDTLPTGRVSAILENTLATDRVSAMFMPKRLVFYHR